jgi:lipopolysaccharide export system protein LptA
MGVSMRLAHAENADKDKPMNIEADELVHDDLKQLTIFTGHVLVNKGTIVLKGDRIEVREDPQGFQYGVITPESGKRAYYRQKREGVNEFMEGEALRIEYDGRLDRVTLQDQAVLRRYRGTVLNDEMSGHVITYDHLSETFRVDAQKVPLNSQAAMGGKNNKSEASALGLLAPRSDSRVRAVLTPVPSTASPSPSSSSTPSMGLTKP